MPFAITTADTPLPPTPQPNNVQHQERPVLDYTLRGSPRYAGFASQVWQWAVLAQAEMGDLWALYHADAPHVQITYHDPLTGGYVTRWAMMHEPRIGQRFTLIYQQVSVLFTRITTEEAT
jgi:hypothetical protein